ncbi:MAG: hypothetical protein DRJ10_14265 [Bacteroidetes bacterium]|nr:MAG: hypothetical protein DRJ10_14265 [Bacteroidota bacterium]
MFKQKIIYSILVIVSLLFFRSATGQTNTIYFMDGIHQSSYLNPAYQDNCNIFIGLPALSGVNLQVGNNTLTYGNLFQENVNSSDTLIVNFNDINNNLQNSNYAIASTAIPVLGLGFWVKNSYFTFNIANKTSVKLSVPLELATLITEGNGNYIGEDNPLVISNFGPQITNYHEFAFGLSRQITHRLFLGARLKLLFGTANAQTKNSEIKITTQEDTYALKLETDMLLNLSGPVTISRDSEGNIDSVDIDDSNLLSYALSTGNLGVAIDLGANYQFNDEFKFFASVTDLGFIHWHVNRMNLTQKESFSFSGLSLDSLNTDYSEFDAILDSLTRFTNLHESANDYNTILNANIFVGATYEVAEFLKLGLLSKTSFYNKDVLQAFTFSTNFTPVKWFSGSLSYTVSNKQYTNFGIGMAFRGGPFQFYVLTDNLNAAFWPKESKAVAIQLGLNLNFGCGKRDDYSIINNKKFRKDIDFM